MRRDESGRSASDGVLKGGVVVLLAGVACWLLWKGLQQEPKPLDPYERIVSSEATAIDRVQAAEALARQGAAGVPQLAEALAHPDSRVRAVSATALGRMGEAARGAFEPLLARLDDEHAEVRANAAVALAGIGHERGMAARRLAALFADEDLYVRQSARDALAALGPEAIPAVCTLIDDSSAEVRRYAASILADLKTNDSAAAAAARTLLKDPDDNVRSEAFGALSAMQALTLNDYLTGLRDSHPGLAVQALGTDPSQFQPGTGEAVAAIADLLSHPDAKVRFHARYRLHKLGPRAAAAIPAMTALMERESGYDKYRSAEALAEMGADADLFVPTLAKLVFDTSDANAHWVAAEALAKYDPDEARRAAADLSERLTSHDALARKAAAASLIALGPQAAPAVPAVLQALEDRGSGIRYQAATILGNMGNEIPEAVPALIAVLNRNEPLGLRVRALEAISSIGPAASAAIPELIRIARPPQAGVDAGADDGRARPPAIAALGKVGRENDDALDAVLAAVGGVSPRVRGAAATAIADIDCPADRAADAMEILLSDEHPYVRIAAADATERLGLVQFLPELIDALSDRNPFVRTAAAIVLGEFDPPDSRAVLPLRAAAARRDNEIQNMRQMFVPTMRSTPIIGPLPQRLEHLKSTSPARAAEVALQRIEGDRQPVP